MMAENFQRSDEHHLPQPKSGGLWDYFDPLQLDNSSAIPRDLDAYRSEDGPVPQDHGFSISFPCTVDSLFTNNQAESDGLLSAAYLRAGKNTVWQTADIPSSLLDTCLTSMASDTHDIPDYDPTDQSALDPSSVYLNDVDYAEEYAPKSGDPGHTLYPYTPFDVGSSSAPLAIGQADELAENRSTTIIHKRKRRVEDFIDRKHALDMCVENMFSGIEKLAEGFGVHFDVVMDLCLQEREKRKSASFHLNDVTETTDFLSLPINTTHSSLSTEDSAPFKSFDGSRTTTNPSKRPRSKPGASQATDQGSGIKRVYCPICHNSLSRHADLRRHLKIHGPGQFQCQYPKCKKTFSRKDKFRDHLRYFHGDTSSRVDTVQRSEDDPENDPDSGSGRAGKFYRHNDPSQGRQKEATSTHLRHSATDGSSNGGMSESQTDREYFWPLLPNIPALEFMKRFECARVIRKLGQGGFGHVFELSLKTGTHGNREAFACKITRLPDRGRRELIERARNEIRVLQVLDHPHIIAFAGAFISNNEIMISTRPVADCNLKVFLSRQSSPLSTVVKCQLWEAVGGLASAIAYLHSHGIGGGFHGDIKPENILVMLDAEVKSWTRLLLADFGSARIPSSNSQIEHGNQGVTPRYCAPEWFTNNNERGPSSDIWSFGCILTQIITYLHNRTMANFEAYRTQNMESRDDWTYFESLPIVNDWLGVLSKNCVEFTGHVGRSSHVDLILDMLLPDPKDRPSAVEVVAKFQAYSKLFEEKTDQDWSCSLRPTWLHFSPDDLVRNVKCACEDQTVEVLGTWREEDIEKLPLISEKSALRKLSETEHATNSPAHALRKTSGMVYAGMAYLAALKISNFICDAPRMYDLKNCVENNIDLVAHYSIATERAREEDLQYNDISTNFVHNSVLKSSRNNLGIKPQHCYQLRLIPESPEMRSQEKKLYSHFRCLKPKPDLGPQMSEQRPRRRPGGRSRRLKPERKMREIRWWNWQTKHTWPFVFFRNLYREFKLSPLRSMMNHKYSLTKIVTSFLPQLVYSRLSDSTMESLIRTNTLGFTTNPITVERFSGPEYETIRLLVTEFVPPNRDFLSSSYIERATCGNPHKFNPSYAPPWGISDPGIHNLKKSCLSHIKSITKPNRSREEYLLGDTSILSLKVFEAVNRYREAGGDTTLLRKACMLHAMCCSMGRIVTFTRTSAEESAANFRSPRLLPYIMGPMLTSRLLNLQIKQVMKSLLDETMPDVLAGLANLIARRPTQSSWAEAFCVFLILDICVEELQVSIDAYDMANLRRNPTCVLDSSAILGSPEDSMSTRLTELFHTAYKTPRSNLSVTKRLGFSPIRDGFPRDESKGVTQQMADLVQDIRQIMEHCGPEMKEKVENPVFETGSDPLTCYTALRKRNSGRLISKFLMSFT